MASPSPGSAGRRVRTRSLRPAREPTRAVHRYRVAGPAVRRAVSPRVRGGVCGGGPARAALAPGPPTARVRPPARASGSGSVGAGVDRARPKKVRPAQRDREPFPAPASGTASATESGIGSRPFSRTPLSDSILIASATPVHFTQTSSRTPPAVPERRSRSSRRVRSYATRSTGPAGRRAGGNLPRESRARSPMSSSLRLRRNQAVANSTGIQAMSTVEAQTRRIRHASSIVIDEAKAYAPATIAIKIRPNTTLTAAVPTYCRRIIQ